MGMIHYNKLLEEALISKSKTKKKKEDGLKTRVDRHKKLIAPMEDGKLQNSHWEYIVPEYFKQALDIRWTTTIKEEFRRKISKNDQKDEHFESYWGQGILLNFSLGDTLYHKSGETCLEVIESKSMEIDEKNKKVLHGYVKFKEYAVKDGKYTWINVDKRKHCTQVEFLNVLINGKDARFEEEII